MKLKSISLPLALLFICRWAACAQADIPPVKNVAAIPTIRFLRPIKHERFFDVPIFLQVQVDGFELLPPGETKSSHVNAGHIQYSFDDYLLIATDETQCMIGKKIGAHYLPVGPHVLKAELVDVNGHSFDPPISVTTEVVSGHRALIETVHTPAGAEQAKLTGQEVYQLHVHLQELEKTLKKLQAGQAGFAPTPVSPGETSE